MKDWKKITPGNEFSLKEGDEIKFHNGYEWATGTLTQFWIDRGYISTGVHNETASFLSPMFGKFTYVKR